ncbi:hypothetical protein ACFMJX_28365, partial [Acinetobacter baumannii]
RIAYGSIQNLLLINNQLIIFFGKSGKALATLISNLHQPFCCWQLFNRVMTARAIFDILNSDSFTTYGFVF